MRFEHILQIYWTKGYFFGGKLFYFNQTFNDIFEQAPGLGPHSKNLFIKRFELTHFRNTNKYEDLVEYQHRTSKPMERAINILFSQINSVNNQLPEVHRLAIIRLYLIKSYRGRSHAIGKPVRGQRTWSNAWNAYNTNKILRNFISESKRLLRQNEREEKINYKVVKKKYGSQKKKKVRQLKRRQCGFKSPIFRFYP